MQLASVAHGSSDGALENHTKTQKRSNMRDARDPKKKTSTKPTLPLTIAGKGSRRAFASGNAEPEATDNEAGDGNQEPRPPNP